MSTTWECRVIDVSTGEILISEGGDDVRPTASIGKVFLLAECAERLTGNAPSLDASARVRRDSTPAVRDSGLWQFMEQDDMCIADLCLLVAAVSDNWATNALLEVIGLDAVDRRAALMGAAQSRLIDTVRDVRSATDPMSPSVGSAEDLAGVAASLHRAWLGTAADGISADAGRLVTTWLRTGVDLSMVAAPFGQDPLSHVEPTDGIRLWNKTGTDTDVRADMGTVWRADNALSYAALATWAPPDDGRADALRHMHDLGRRLKALLADG